MTSQWQTITRDFCRGLRLLGILCEFRTQQGPFDARFRLTNRCGLDRPQQIGHQIHTAHVSFRLIYLPLVMVYFAYGALGIIDVTRDMWIKESLTLSPAELAAISVWFLKHRNFFAKGYRVQRGDEFLPSHPHPRPRDPTSSLRCCCRTIAAGGTCRDRPEHAILCRPRLKL